MRLVPGLSDRVSAHRSSFHPSLFSISVRGEVLSRGRFFGNVKKTQIKKLLCGDVERGLHLHSTNYTHLTNSMTTIELQRERDNGAVFD